MLEEFLRGQPSIYDVGSFLVIVLLLFVLIGVHTRQMRHGREIAKITARLDMKIDKVVD